MKINLEKNRKKYVVNAGDNYKFRSKNAVFFNAGSSWKHEIMKAVVGLMLLKYGDVDISPKIISALNLLEEALIENFKDFPRQKANFISEAVPKSCRDRRVDIIRLEDETWIEIETDHKIQKENCITIYV